MCQIVFKEVLLTGTKFQMKTQNRSGDSVLVGA